MVTEELLDLIRNRYLQSPDFNGFHLHGLEGVSLVEAATNLVEQGLVQVVSNADYPNIHIRPWQSCRSIRAQTQDLRDLRPRDYGVCIYPTKAGMKGVRLPKRLSRRPFARAMALGKGTLDLAYFSLDVLEQYRNDSRFHFSFGDFGATMSLTDDAYLDEAEFERDRVYLNHIGFAYDMSGYDASDVDSPIVRRVAVFHCDLVKLTPEHQQRWSTYGVPDDGLEPHPVWWGSQMGHWPREVGPFDRFFSELNAINELTRNTAGADLFAVTDRPGDLGWLLRPSQREWDDFVVQLDKLLSENIRHKFFDSEGISKYDAEGRSIGSLSRFAIYMTEHGITDDKAREALRPLREVRRERQGPAHSLRTNITDRSFIHRQVALLSELNQSLVGIRNWLRTHPANAIWEHPYAKYTDLRM